MLRDFLPGRFSGRSGDEVRFVTDEDEVSDGLRPVEREEVLVEPE